MAANRSMNEIVKLSNRCSHCHRGTHLSIKNIQLPLFPYSTYLIVRSVNKLIYCLNVKQNGQVRIEGYLFHLKFEQRQIK